MAGIKRQKRFPIGYRIQNGRAEVVPEEAELVQRIFRDYLVYVSNRFPPEERCCSSEMST